MIAINTVFEHRNRTQRGKPRAIEIRITHNRRSQYISTGIRLKASEYRDGRIINRPDSDILNERLSIIRTGIEAKASIIEFDTWLHNRISHSSRYPDVEKRLDTSTIYNQHKNLKRMLRLAVETGLLQNFRPSDTSRLRIARDIFVCQMYTGMSFADMLKATKSKHLSRDVCFF